MSETDDTEQTQKNRREFIQQSAGLAAIGAATNLTGDSKQESAQENELFQPEEFWKDRMKQPDDGKNFGWFVDTRRCFGCHACEVSCKAETMCRLATTSGKRSIRMMDPIQKLPVCSCQCPANTARMLLV